jgi:hypothetical protein
MTAVTIGRRNEAMRKVILFVTYTMSRPTVAGVFLRAVRLAHEMARRGWSPVICNQGSWIDDPKVEAGRGVIEFRTLNKSGDAHLDEARAFEEFRELNPDLVVMGEGPFPINQVFYNAAIRLQRPFIVLDQLYHSWLIPPRPGVDLALHYALTSFWDDLQLPPPNETMPPFIEEVAPKAALPIADSLHDRPWITLVANDDAVLRRGIELLARVQRSDALFVTVSRSPDDCTHLSRQHGIDESRFVALPPQPDSIIFGLFAGSAAALAANGFMQIMECLAMACPIVALARGYDVGPILHIEIAERFAPFISVREEQERQLQRLHDWLDASPFTFEQRTRLTSERNGLAYCATRIEQLYRSRTFLPSNEVTPYRHPSWLRRAAGASLIRAGEWLQR